MDLASAWPLEVKFIITLRRSTPVIEYRRFELPLSNRKYTDFFENTGHFGFILKGYSSPDLIIIDFLDSAGQILSLIHI